MAKNVWNALSYLIPGLRVWRFGLNALNGNSLVDNDAKGLLSDIGQSLSDTFFGTTYNQQDLQENAQQFNSAQAQISRDWQEMMYNRYESPQALMQQFRDAGLNPALMYGSSSPSPSFSDSPASIGVGSAAHGNISLSDALLGAQIANINADTENKKGHTRAVEIQNKVDAMNADAFEEFYNKERGRIVGLMSKELGFRDNQFVLSNYETFEAAWNASIMFGLSYSDALSVGNSDFLTYGGSTGELLDLFSKIDTSDMYKKHKELFIGGYDAEISANAAIRVLNAANMEKNKKNLDIWKYLNDKAEHGDKWERIGAQVALTMLFISEQNFNIPMPNLRFTSFKRGGNSTTVNHFGNETHENRFRNMYN